MPVPLACSSVNVISTYSRCFQRNDSLRQAIGKSALKIQLQVEVSQHLSIPPTAAVLGVSVVLWTVTWPVHGTVQTFIQTLKAWLVRQPQACDIYLCSDLYFDYSTKSRARAARATTTRINQLQPQTPLPNREAVLKTSTNKVQLNALISYEILNDYAFLKSATASHQLLVTGEKYTLSRCFRVTYSHEVIFQ